LFGAEYASYWPVGVALLATTLLVSLNQTADRAFVAAGRVWLSTSNNILWLILFAGLGVIMIPLLLAFGYAAAYLLSFGLYVAWQFGWLQRLWTVPIGTLRSMLIVSAILFGTAAVGAGALQPVTQLVFACIWTSLVVVVEFAFFLRTDERQSLALHVSQVVRRFAS
jgi:O-antigen/teichoic acid export membrane protein